MVVIACAEEWGEQHCACKARARGRADDALATRARQQPAHTTQQRADTHTRARTHTIVLPDN